jgi:hypothetical protein
MSMFMIVIVTDHNVRRKNKEELSAHMFSLSYDIYARD